jgi:hypothetical protein
MILMKQHKFTDNDVEAIDNVHIKNMTLWCAIPFVFVLHIMK